MEKQELDKVLNLIKDREEVSISFIQRELPCGFNRAGRILKELVELGYIKEEKIVKVISIKYKVNKDNIH